MQERVLVSAVLYVLTLQVLATDVLSTLVTVGGVECVGVGIRGASVWG